MSETRKASENNLVTLKKPLLQMPEYMKIFSLSMRSLYADEAVSKTSTDAARKFRKLRDETRQHAVVYLKYILPVTTEFVMVLKDFFATYDALSFEEWREMLPDILDETTSHKDLAQTVVTMHQELMTPLKERQDAAEIILKKHKDLQERYEKQSELLAGSAESSRKWAIALLFIPVVNLIAYPLLRSRAKEDEAKAIAKHAESEIHEAAALVVAKTLIPALTNFVDGLIKAAGFFQTMESELQSMVETTDKSFDTRKRLYFMRGKNEAKDLKSLCQAFYAVLPDVRTDFELIPTEGTNQEIVDKWLKKQREAIATKRSSVQKILLSIFQESKETENYMKH